MLNKILPIVVVMMILVAACNKPEETTLKQDYKPTPYILKVPKGFPLYIKNPDNPLTEEGVALGKRLYNETMLSSNGRSCASCHIKDKSFSLPIHIGANGYRISVPPHINLAFKRHYNWTGSEKVLDTLCIADFGPEFFNTDSAELYRNLSNNAFYRDAFYKAFLIDDIYQYTFVDLQRKIAYAISQYMRTIISSNAKYDKIMKGEETFTAQEQEGYNIFFSEVGDCFHCHQPPLFSDTEFHNNGLNNVFTGFDNGRFLITQNRNDIGKFATPTLRNSSLTAPYMHDGRYATLEDVVEFYNSGVQPSATVDPIINKKAPTYKLNLTTQQKQALVAFLETLTDNSITYQ